MTDREHAALVEALWNWGTHADKAEDADPQWSMADMRRTKILAKAIDARVASAVAGLRAEVEARLGSAPAAWGVWWHRPAEDEDGPIDEWLYDHVLGSPPRRYESSEACARGKATEMSALYPDNTYEARALPISAPRETSGTTHKENYDEFRTGNRGDEAGQDGAASRLERQGHAPVSGRLAGGDDAVRHEPADVPAGDRHVHGAADAPARVAGESGGHAVGGLGAGAVAPGREVERERWHVWGTRLEDGSSRWMTKSRPDPMSYTAAVSNASELTSTEPSRKPIWRFEAREYLDNGEPGYPLPPSPAAPAPAREEEGGPDVWLVMGDIGDPGEHQWRVQRAVYLKPDMAAKCVEPNQVVRAYIPASRHTAEVAALRGECEKRIDQRMADCEEHERRHAAALEAERAAHAKTRAKLEKEHESVRRWSAAHLEMSRQRDVAQSELAEARGRHEAEVLAARALSYDAAIEKFAQLRRGGYDVPPYVTATLRDLRAALSPPAAEPPAAPARRTLSIECSTCHAPWTDGHICTPAAQTKEQK